MQSVEQVAVVIVELLAEISIHPELVFDPHRTRHQELAQTAGRNAEIGLDDTSELADGLVVEADGTQLIDPDAGLAQAIGHRLLWKPRITLLARESLFGRSRDDLAVAHNGGGAVVVVGRDAQDRYRRHL